MADKGDPLIPNQLGFRTAGSRSSARRAPVPPNCRQPPLKAFDSLELFRSSKSRARLQQLARSQLRGGPFRDHRLRQTIQSISYLSKNVRTRFETEARFVNWHSQMVNTSQPRFRSSDLILRSRMRFPSSFGSQNPNRLFGRRASLQDLAVCLCQKHPCTKMIRLRPANTRSGRPGSLLSWRRYR